MGERPRLRAAEYSCKENARRHKEQFINSINNDIMTSEIIKELSVEKNTSERA